jgi:hypothetical protein
MPVALHQSCDNTIQSFLGSAQSSFGRLLLECHRICNCMMQLDADASRFLYTYSASSCLASTCTATASALVQYSRSWPPCPSTRPCAPTYPAYMSPAACSCQRHSLPRLHSCSPIMPMRPWLLLHLLRLLHQQRLHRQATRAEAGRLAQAGCGQHQHAVAHF